MTNGKETLSFSGDIVAMADVAVNTNSGSLIATLKKGIREKLGRVGDKLSAAVLQFSNGQSVVLLSGTADSVAPASVRVTQLGNNRFEVELDTGEDKEVDKLTAAFLMAKADQFEKAKLPLLPSVTADQWQENMEATFAEAEAKAKRKHGPE